MDNVIVIRYAEIHLKGLNRPYFERALVRNVALALRNIRGAKVVRAQSRVYVEGVSDAQLAEALDALSRVYGIHSYSPAVRLEQDFDKAAEVLAEQVRAERVKYSGDTVTFRVEARRADKRFPIRSNEMAAKAGGRILELVPGLKVDLEHPQITANLEMREQAYCYTAVLPGPGGMPVGCNGSTTLLLSGGIDSPV